MNSLFDPYSDLIYVQVNLFGSTGAVKARLILDTGANLSVVRNALLESIGYTPDLAIEQKRLVMGSGTETVSLFMLEKLEALDQERLDFEVLAHTLPASARVDGVLGLDFFRHHVLTLDFQNGEIILV